MHTPQTDALVARHQRELEELPMNPPLEVMLALNQRQALELMNLCRQFEQRLG